jgi:F-type H+-transporting ATPase subunit delta
MSEFRVASRYAKSLIDLAKEQNVLDVVFRDMKDFSETLRKDPQIEVMLKSPVITGAQKAAILNKIFSKTYHATTMSLLNFVLEKNRGEVMGAVARIFIEQYQAMNNIVKASVKTAFVLDDNTAEEIRRFAEKYTGKKVELQATVDARLIGGFVLQMGDRLYDASISGKLRETKNNLINTYISK